MVFVCPCPNPDVYIPGCSYRYTEHEKAIADIAREIGFTQISVSHETSPLMKLVSRGDTTTVDAYLTPILRRYVDQVRNPDTLHDMHRWKIRGTLYCERTLTERNLACDRLLPSSTEPN